MTTEDGCISDFDNGDVINCTYGDQTATRTIALAGGSHAEHWITALDTLGRHAPLQGGHLPEDGLPADHRGGAAGHGRQPRPTRKCHDWVQQAMAKLLADHPDYVFTTSTRPWNIKPGDVMPGIYIGIWKTFADNNIPVLAMRDTPWLVETASRSSRRTAWPTAAMRSLRLEALRGTRRSQPDTGFRRAVPGAQTARHERCGVPPGLSAGRWREMCWSTTTLTTSPPPTCAP